MLPTLLRFKDLQERGIVKSREQLRQIQQNYGFPLGRWMTPNTRVWTEAEIAGWLESRPQAIENKPVVISDKHISRRIRKSAEAS
jgi:hypothetical protein